MTDTDSPIEVVQHPYAFRLLRVLRRTRIAPRMMRITLGGEELAGFRSDAPDDDTKMFFPSDPTSASWRPEIVEGRLVFSSERPPARELTPRRYDPVAGELDYDFVLHGDGPAATWAASAQPGHVAGVGGPRRSRMVTGHVDWYLLAGDETGLPAIARRLEELPAGTRVIAIIEVDGPEAELEIGTRADADIVWLRRTGAADQLAQAIRDLDFPEGAVFAWAAGEAAEIRAVRRHLLDERRIPDTRMRMTGYWRRAIANWDHHQPLDEIDASAG